MIPGPLKTFAKAVIPVDVFERLEVWTGQRDDLTPPRRLEFVGTGNFKEHGRLFTQRFQTIADLKPDSRVLDIGSGVGRIAVGLVKYLSPAPNGGYDGLEIVKAGVEWCQQAITSRYPHFRFHHFDIYNKFYNPDGQIKPSEMVFPFADSTFDLIVLTSVFTHMLEHDVERYLSEISRVLKPDGRVYATLFLLNDESRQLVKAGRTTITLEPFTEVSMVRDPDVPEDAIAFEEEWVKAAIARAGLQLKDHIRYGEWVARKTFYDYQDTLVLVKRKA